MWKHRTFDSICETIELKNSVFDKDIEAYAIKIQSTGSKFCVLSIYRSPSGNFGYFLNKLNDIL
jgi:hypothetical protein